MTATYTIEGADYNGIKKYLQKDTSDEILNMIEKGQIITPGNPPRNEVDEKLKQLFGLLGNIKSVKKDGTEIIIAASELVKIHFLAAAICQRFVLECLEKIKQLKSKESRWEDIKIVVTNLLTLDTSAPTKINYFYINPVANDMNDINKILMYQLLQQLITNNMNPNIDDVLDFLSKIDASWCVAVDKATVKKLLDLADNAATPMEVFTTFVADEPVRSLARLNAHDPNDDDYVKALEYKEAANFIAYINEVITNATAYNANMNAFFQDQNYKDDIAKFKLILNGASAQTASNGTTYNLQEIAEFIINNPYDADNNNYFSIVKFLEEVQNLKKIITKIKLLASKNKKIKELFRDPPLNFAQFINQFTLIKAGYENNLLSNNIDTMSAQADKTISATSTFYKNKGISNADLINLEKTINAL